MRESERVDVVRNVKDKGDREAGAREREVGRKRKRERGRERQMEAVGMRCS